MAEPGDERACVSGRSAPAATPARRQALLTISATATCALCLAGTLPRPPDPLLVWNASPSSPVGLYLVGSPAGVKPGDTIIAWPPLEARRLAARRHYLPAHVPLVKRVAAISGARVCATGRRIEVDDRLVALRQARDPLGRRLPWWSGCNRLRTGDLFLLSAHAPDAYDGRYFGVTRSSEVIGSGTLLWPR